MRARRRPIAVAAAIFVFALLEPTASTTAACLSTWTRTGVIEATMGAAGLSALAEDDAWLVGTTPLHEDSRIRSLRWDGDTWSPIAMPQPGTYPDLLDMDFLNADDGWAVGTHLRRTTPLGAPLFLHWAGGAWTRIKAPMLEGGVATGVAMIATDDVWASVRYLEAGGSRGGMLHWDGEAWTQVDTPEPAGSDQFLTAVDASATDDVWAVGYGYAPNALVALHWDGEGWTDRSIDRDFAPLGAGFLGVAALDDGRAWAVGHVRNARDPVAYRWVVDHWVKSALPDTAPGEGTVLFDVEERDGRLVAVGGEAGFAPLLWVREGGAWTPEAAPGTGPRILFEVDVADDGAWFAAGIRDQPTLYTIDHCPAV